MSYLKSEPINDFNDISYVNPEIEYSSGLVLSFDILSDSFFNILPTLLLALIEGINLILLGHYDNPNTSAGYQLFNFFEIGVVYINLFGFAFAIGILKSLKKEISNLEKNYLNTKAILIGIVILVILPLNLISYYILSSVYSEEGQATISNLWIIYKNFLVFAPLIVYFQLLLQLNLRIFQIYNMRSISLWIFILHILLHLFFSYFFVYYLNFQIKGIAFSLIATSLICYVISNKLTDDYIIREFNFYIIPNINFDVDSVIDTMKINFVTGMITYLEYAGMGFFILFSLLINNESLTANIIIVNFISILHIIGNGFSSTLKRYIQLSTSSYKHSHIGKRKFTKYCVSLTIIMALVFSLIILMTKSKIVRVYLNESELSYQSKVIYLFDHIIKYFSFIIFFDYISRILDGYVKGIDANITHLLFFKLSFLLIFVPFGLILCFVYGYGLMGFWAVIYAYIVIHTILDSFFVYKYYELWMY